MANQPVVIGSAGGDGSGDTVAEAAAKINDNFEEIYGGAWNPASFKASRFVVDSGSINTQSGTAYTLQATDNGKFVHLTHNGDTQVVITVPAGLPVGFTCYLMQGGTSGVSLSASGSTVYHALDHSSISGQYGVVGLCSYATNVFLLTGNTSSITEVNVYAVDY